MSFLLQKFKDSVWYNFFKDYTTLMIFMLSIVVAIGTAFIKLIQYLFLCGSFSFWHIPNELIKVDNGFYSIIKSIFYIIINIFCIFTLSYMRELFKTRIHKYQVVTKNYKKRKIDKMKYLIFTYVTLLFNLTLVIGFNYFSLIIVGMKFYSVMTLISSVLNSIIQYAYSFFPIKTKKTNSSETTYIPKENVSKEDIAKAEEEIKRTKVKLNNLIPKFILWMTMVLFVVVSLFSYYYGYSNERTKEEFYIAKSYNSKIVVYQDDAKFILMESNKNKVDRIYEIVQSNQIGILIYEKLGMQTVE